MLFAFPKPLSLRDLQKNEKLTRQLRPPAEFRKSIPIAVIDDQPFAPEHNLKNNNFQISTFKDIQNITQIADFPIVLCDLQGVGLQLGGDLQGAFLIEEIKRNFPEKAVIAFTGGSAISGISRRAAAAADDNLRKDASIEDWREVLDKHIRNLSDPVHVWRQMRLRLVKADVTPIELVKLEHAYVNSIQKGAADAKIAIGSIADSEDTAPAVKREIAGFLASKAFELVFEAIKNYSAG